jgi:hypothetical protein
MRKNVFSANMKIIFLSCFFMFVTRIVCAPTKDFLLKFTVIQKGIELVESRHHESEFSRFVNDLGFTESGNNWLSVNCIGCFGEWQFAESTVQFLGFRNVTLRKFKADSSIFPRELQRLALESLIKVNLSLLKDYKHYIGDTIKGVVVTKSGLIAASHLGGARTVQLYLASNGRVNKEDCLGTSVGDYMRKFGKYELD